MDHKEILARMRFAFQAEASDLLNELDSSLLQLEADPANADFINRVFRAMHTLKGSGATAGFERLSHFAHLAEEVFNAARDGKVQITSELIDLAHRACGRRQHARSSIQNRAGVGSRTEGVYQVGDSGSACRPSGVCSQLRSSRYRSRPQEVAPHPLHSRAAHAVFRQRPSGAAG